MERERFSVREIPTEELLGRMVMSWIFKNWKFRNYEYVELLARAGRATPVILAGAGVGLTKIVGEAGKGAVKSMIS